MSVQVGVRGRAGVSTPAQRPDSAAGVKRLAGWINSVQAAGGLQDLTHLEIWLKALSAFLNPEHIPLTATERADIADRNFAAEARIARRAIQTAEMHAANLLAPGARTNGAAAAHEGGPGVESRACRKPLAAQSAEELARIDSLMRLLEVLNDLRVLIDTSAGQRHFPYQHYLALGRLYRHSLKDCRYLDMLMGQKFKPQYDLIDNAALITLVRRIGDDRLRQNVATVLLHLFQLQRILLLPGAAFGGDGTLRHHLAVFALLHEEMSRLCSFIRSRFGKKTEMTTQLRATMSWICESLRISARRAIEKELAHVAGETSPPAVASKIARAYDSLQGCFQGCTVTLAQTFEPWVGWNDLFVDVPASVVASQKVHRDLWELRLYVRFLATRNDVSDLEGLVERLVAFREAWLHYFADSDWGEFERLSGILMHSRSEREFHGLLTEFSCFLETLAEGGTAQTVHAGTRQATPRS
jgi:hypothetical protein